MCQSKAEGGRRCSFHLEQGVGTGMTAYAASVTGLTPKEVSAAHDALEREGQHAPAPTREEVDEFLEKQIFRVRHEPDLTEKRRESIIARLKAAIGRILPSGARFHAWKNLVAESWSQVRRKAAAAFVVGALSFGVVGCGNAPEASPPDRAENVAAAPATPVYDTTWEDGRTKVSAEAVDTYGKQEVQAATETVESTVRDYAFDSDLILSTPQDSKHVLLSLSDHMTPDAQRDWEAAVNGYVAEGIKNEDAAGTVYGIAFTGIHPSGAKFDGAPVEAPVAGPGAVNQEITETKVSVNDDGRLKVVVHAEADVRVSHDGQPKLWHFTRENTYWLEKSGETWLIDGWNHTYKAGDGLHAER